MADDARWVHSMPEVYDRLMGPTLFAPFAEELASRAAGLAPGTVLELAAGTGILTAALVRALPDARIVATDLNPAMVAWGGNRAPGATWQTADAMAVPLPDASFDLVVCQFGVMFLPDKPAAYREMRRLLRPGGTVLVAVWDDVDGSPIARALADSVTDVCGPGAPDFVQRVPHGYHDPERIRADAEAGGLTVASLDHVVLRSRAASARAVTEGFCYGSPLRFGLEERGDLDQLFEALAGRMTDRLGPGPVDQPMAAFVLTATGR